MTNEKSFNINFKCDLTKSVCSSRNIFDSEGSGQGYIRGLFACVISNLIYVRQNNVILIL